MFFWLHWISIEYLYTVWVNTHYKCTLEMCILSVEKCGKVGQIGEKCGKVENLNKFKYLYAKARRIIRENMRKSWRDYVSQQIRYGIWSVK